MSTPWAEIKHKSDERKPLFTPTEFPVNAGAPVPATPAEIARGLANAFDTGSMHIFSSWTMGDLYRAIQGEPHTHDATLSPQANCGGCAAIKEYVNEIVERRKASERQQALEADLARRFGIEPSE